MPDENALMPFSQDLEKVLELTWQQFIDRTNELNDKLLKMYDESTVKRREYGREVCWEGYNFGKTVDWVLDYSPHPKALESIASALESIVQWPNAGSMAWEMRRFIKFSTAHDYNNVPEVIEFGNYIKKIGNDDSTNKNCFQIDMDFLVWDSGVDGESSYDEMLQSHIQNVRGVVRGLERHAHPEIIDIEREPTKEDIEAQEREIREQYQKDFLADAKSFYKQFSVFDYLDRADLMVRPHHRIMVYPVELSDVAEGRWIGKALPDASDTLTLFYKESPFMVEERQNSNTWPSTESIGTHFERKYDRRLKRTLKDKPWLIDFSVKYMDLFGKSFIGGNHGCNHAGEVELVFKNPDYDPQGGNWSNNEYGHRILEPEEERMFIESVTKVESLAHVEPSIRPPEQSWVFNGQSGTPYKISLQDCREFTMFLKKEYGSIYREGKMAIITEEGPEPLFR